MSLQQLLIFLLLAQSVFCFMTQNDSERCSEEQLEHFLKQQYLSSSDSGGGYRLIVKENLKLHSAALTSKERYFEFTDKDQMVQYQVELTGDIGVKPITTAFIQIDVGGCQQPAGWFDQLDPQWNVTQCILDKQVFLQVVTNPHQKIKISWTNSLNCVTTFRYRVDEDSFNAGIRMRRQSPSSSQSESAETPYLLLANHRYIHQISLDGSRQRTIISEPSQNIYTLDYHSRLKQLFWIGSGRIRVQSSIDGSQQTTHRLGQYTCLDGIAVDWISDKLYFHDQCYYHIGVLDLASNLQTTIDNSDANFHYTYYRHMIVDPMTRLLYWNSDRGVERMSMDGKNRTAIIDVDTRSDHDAIVSLTLDYQAQVLYWVFANYSNGSLIIKNSNTDGTNQQTILRLQNVYYHYYDYYYYPPGLTMYNKTLFLSLPRTRDLYKIGINGDTSMFINSSAQVFCRFRNYQLKATSNQPSGYI